jgi:PleD family two-component response regulator
MPAISVSIGVAAHQPGMPLDELMQHADRSLYVAKEQGRDSVVVELERFVAA